MFTRYFGVKSLLARVCAVTQSILQLTRNTWGFFTRPLIWVLILRTHVEPIPMVTTVCPQAICRSLLSLQKPCKAAMLPRAQIEQNHSWQNTQHKISSEGKNKAGKKFKESEQMKIIIRPFQRQNLGGLKGSKTKFSKGKAETAKGSQLF